MAQVSPHADVPSELVVREQAGFGLRALAAPRRDAHQRVPAQQELAHRLGLHVPLLVIHDLSLALAERDAPWREEVEVPRALQAGWQTWASWLTHVHASGVGDVVSRIGPPPGILTALIVQLLRPVLECWPPASDPVRMMLQVRLDPRDTTAPALDGRGLAELNALFALIGHERRRLEVGLERLDLDTLRLLSMIEADAFDAPNADDLHRLLLIFDRPSAHDVVNFALQLLPSVLDARHKPSAQVYAVNGYRGLTRSGVLDDLLLTELAADEDIFLQRWVEQELFYHERERTRDREPERHLILIDATAGMRGLRDTFARGVALALVQKLLDEKKRVTVAFFDCGLHQRVEVGPGSRSVTHLLGFVEGRGRDYARAFAEILREATRMRDESRDDLVISFITHGRCLVPLQTIVDLTAVARVLGVFVQPGGQRLEVPEYAHLLTAWEVVDERTLSRSEGRMLAARKVLSMSGERS